MDVRAAHTREGEAGVTVAQLAATIAIGAILTAFAAPNVVQTLRVYSLRGAAREVFSELQNARMAAVTENNRYRFSLQSSHVYRIHDDADADGVEDAGETVSDKDIEVGSDSVALSATGPVTFAANGTAPDSATFTLTNPFGDTIQVAVSPAGRIRIQ